MSTGATRPVLPLWTMPGRPLAALGFGPAVSPGPGPDLGPAFDLGPGPGLGSAAGRRPAFDLTPKATLRIRGGPGGTTARLADMNIAAARLRRLTTELGDRAAAVLAIGGASGLAVTALVSPITWAVAEGALGLATAGPHGLLPAAARAGWLAGRLELVVEGYQLADREVSGLLHRIELHTGQLIGFGLRPALPVLLTAGLAGLAVERTVTGRVGWAGRVGVAPPPGARRSEPSSPMPGGWLQVAEQRAGTLLVRYLDAPLRSGLDADLGDHLVAVVPGVVSGLLAGLPPPLWRLLSGRDDPPETMPELARAVDLVAAGTGWLRESQRVQVAVGPARLVAAPTGVADVLERIPPKSTTGTLQVELVTSAAGRRAWIVLLPGTSSWSPRAGRTPFDLTGDVHLMAGQRTAGTAAVAEAMRRIGVRSGEPVLLAGYSQGGMAAAELAADADFRSRFAVSHLVTAGSPIGSALIPPDVQVLALEHADDLIPRLDGIRNPDRPDWLTVTQSSVAAPASRFHAGSAAADVQPRSGLLASHHLSGYRVTAAAVDASANPSLVGYRAGLTPFLGGTGVQSVIYEVTVTRLPP